MIPDITPGTVAAAIVQRLTDGAAIVPHPNYYFGNIADADTLRVCIEAAIREGMTRELRRAIRALCPNCSSGHVLDNGRLWAMCGAQRLLPAYSEKELIAAILATKEEPVGGR